VVLNFLPDISTISDFQFVISLVNSPRLRFACRPSLLRKEGEEIVFDFTPPLSGGERGLGGESTLKKRFHILPDNIQGNFVRVILQAAQMCQYGFAQFERSSIFGQGFNRIGRHT
jgi:hypothetical protein